MELYKEHEKRHELWEQRDSKFLERYSSEEIGIITKFMREFNVYLEEKIEEYTND